LKTNLIPDSLFQDDQLFNTLEKYAQCLLDKSPSKINSNHKQGHNHEEIINILQESITQFQNRQDNENAREERIAGFLVLDFVIANYGLEFMEIGKKEQMEEKMRLMSTSIQLSVELEKTICYSLEIKKLMNINKEDELVRNQIGEEIMMVYNFFNLLVSKNHHIFSNPGMEDYIQADELESLKLRNEKIITEMIESKTYYLHHKDKSRIKKHLHS
jgi:hypothetical protein